MNNIDAYRNSMRRTTQTLSTVILMLSILVIWNSCHQQNGELTTVILVRHAEKSSANIEDVPLTDKGYQRASLLADMLADFDISAIYVTQWQRTRLTAQPLSEQSGMPVTVNVITDAAEHSRELASMLRKPEYAGKTVVCVEHSNTIPMILSELGSSDFNSDVEYNQMFVVTLSHSSKPKLLILRYDL